MNIINKPIEEIIPYTNNPRKNDPAVDSVAASIKEFGFKVPVVLTSDNVIVAGHTRLKAAKKLKMKEIPCIIADDLTEEQIKAFRLADNKVSELAEWDDELLRLELDDILNIDMSKFGFDLDLDTWENTGVAGSIKDDYIIPPFSVLNTRDGDWQERKKAWIALGIDSGKGRKDDLLKGHLKELIKNSGKGKNISQTSIFDPVLCEIMYKWFNVDNGSIYDCFAGGGSTWHSSRVFGLSVYGYRFKT